MIIRWGYPYAGTRVVTIQTVANGRRRGVSSMVYTIWKNRRNRHKRKLLAGILWGMRKNLRRYAEQSTVSHPDPGAMRSERSERAPSNPAKEQT